MAFFTFQSPSAEILGNPAANENDTFVASNFNLNAGDRALGGLGMDRLEYFADTTLTATPGQAQIFGRDVRLFSGFILDSVETVSVTNDSGLTLVFDLSSSSFTDGRQGVSMLEVTNSTFGVVFDQVGPTNTPGGSQIAAIRLDSQTSPTTSNVTVGYQANVLAGANDTVNLTLSNTNAAVVRIGTSNGAAIGQPSNAGVETVNLNVSNGASVIQQLDTNLTTLNISASPNFQAGDGFTITGPLNTTVRTITSSFQGNIGLSWANNGAGQGVTYTGSQTGTGVNTLTAGAGNDVITTFAGADVIDGGAGNDTINAGNGQNRITTGTGTDSITGGEDRDRVFANGTGVKTVNLNGGDDVVDYSLSTSTLLFTGGTGNDIVVAGGNFNAGPGLDRLDFGASTVGDFLYVNGGETDVQFTQVTGLEYLLITTAGTTTLAQNAFNAGINSIVLQSGSNAQDVVDASQLARSVTVRSFNQDGVLADDPTLPFAQRFRDAVSGAANNDSITTGAFADAFEWRGDGSLTGADNLDAGASAAGTSDGLYLAGDTDLANGGGFRNFEFVALESGYGTIYGGQTGANSYRLTLTDANAPSAGRDLNINGSNLNNNRTVGGAAENVYISTLAVTTFNTNIITGTGDDQIILGNRNHNIRTLGGNDNVTDGAGDDIIDTGAEATPANVLAVTDDDTVTLTSGNNQVFDAFGNNTITLGTGNDRVFVGNGTDLIIAGANLNANDFLVDNGGIDTVRIGGRNYGDADFTGVGPTGSQAFEILQIAGDGTTTVLGANAQRAGFRTVVSLGAGASVIDAGAFTAAANLTVDLTAGGDDTVILGAGNDTVITGVGNNTIVGNAGNDIVRVSGAELNVLDVFQGGLGTDSVELDNSLGAITAVVDLSRVTSVENFRFTSNGDRIPNTNVGDADANNLTFAATNANTVNTLTPINIDTSTITDVVDSATITFDVGLNDADFAFNISGNAVRTTVVKNNVGINNNINFQGGAGVDTFVVSGVAGGSDLGSTTVFDGKDGEDVIFQNGGVINDDSYVQVSNVEVLTGAAGALNATLGAQAARSGLQIIRGTAGNDQITLDAAFVPAVNSGNPSVPRLTVDLGTGGDDQINARASTVAVTFTAQSGTVTAADVLQGGTSVNDVLNLSTLPGTTSANDLTNVIGVETINVTLPASNNVITTTTVTLGNTPVDGGVLTINATDAVGFASINNDFVLNGQNMTARQIVTSGSGFDIIRTGSAADTINTNAGNDTVFAGAGDDQVNAGTGADAADGDLGTDTINGDAGADTLRGGAGTDTINGGDDGDFIRGWIDSDTIAAGTAALNAANEADTINGGAGNDFIEGGAGIDQLTGGTGADVFLYRNRADSTLALGGRDVILDHVSGVDVIDALSVREAVLRYGAGATVRFGGNATSFGDTQSLINAGDNVFDIAYDQSTDTLWFDLNDDGSLDGNDLQITVRTTGFTVNGDTGLQAQDVLANLLVGGGNYTAFDNQFAAVLP